jgi:hypothetical protein
VKSPWPVLRLCKKYFAAYGAKGRAGGFLHNPEYFFGGCLISMRLSEKYSATKGGQRTFGTAPNVLLNSPGYLVCRASTW